MIFLRAHDFLAFVEPEEDGDGRGPQQETAELVPGHRTDLGVAASYPQGVEDYLELLTAVEATAEELGVKIVLEGYPPPRDPRLKVHLYGKDVKPGRKVGHVTAYGDDLEEVRERALHAAAWFRGDLGDESD